MDTKSHRKLPIKARIKAKNAMRGPMNDKALGSETRLKKYERNETS
jgi:hypothetical protein